MRRRRRRRLLHHFVLWWRRDLRAPRRDAQPHAHLEVVGFDAVAPVERGVCARRLDGEDLAAMALHARAHGLLAQILGLLLVDAQTLQILAGKDDRRAHLVLDLAVRLDESLRVGGEVEGALDGLEPVVLRERLCVGREARADAVHQVLAKLGLLGVKRRDQQRAARVAHREPLPLDGDPSGGERLEKQVGCALVEQVDVVHIKHAAVRLREEPRLKDGVTGAHRLLDVDRAKQPVLEHVERDLHKWRLDDLGLQILHLHFA
mmetsp:Transcript_9394/g.20553  ORF Transcript_9394/g.20553 Transcript_9394/m.20553 type:complete len:262 (-) Transcript_9394:561-1346(-)